MSLFLLPEKGYKTEKHLTFFEESGRIKSDIKPELLKVPLIRNLVNKYGKILASDILAVINLYINKDLYNQFTDTKRLIQCINIVEYKSAERKQDISNIDILSCTVCAEIIAKFSVARLDAYEASFATLENVIKDTSEILELTRGKLAIRRGKLTSLEFDNIEDPDVQLKIQELLAMLDKDFKSISDYSNNLVRFNKSIKELKDRKVDNRQSTEGIKEDADPMGAIFDK